VQRFDWGDAPESGTFPAPNNRTYAYGTTGAASGANHGIISTLYIGATVDDESNGQPNAAADGDDIATTDDEDGVTIPRFVANTPQDVQVQVYNNTGVGATLVGWVDFNGNGKFDAPEVDSNNNGVFDGTEVDINSNGEFDPPEGVSVTVPSSSSIQYPLLRFLVPNDADIATVGSTYARFRLSTDPTLTVSTPTGNAIDGEVEDYRVTSVVSPGLAVTKTNGTSAVVAGQFTEYTITIANSGSPQTNITVLDDIVSQNTGVVAGTETWTCETFLFPTPPGPAADSPSCVSGVIAATANGTGAINQLVDLPTYTGVTFRLRVQISAAATAVDAPIRNRVTASTNATPPLVAESTDQDAIIFDPPFGTKLGVYDGGVIIRWTQVWVNTSGGFVQGITIADTVRAPQTFAGNITCTLVPPTTATTVLGVPVTSQTTRCAYDAGTNQVIWQGNMDFGTGDGRIEIAFDARIPNTDFAQYDNSASFSATTPSISAATTSPASASVTVGTASGGGAAPGLLDPAIVKLVDPTFALPGEIVTWTISVFNPNDVQINNVGFSDIMPNELEVLEATTTLGSVTTNGQNVSFFMDPLGPRQTATVIVRTRLRPEALRTTSIVVNTVRLNIPYKGQAQASLFVVTSLPATGEPAFWWRILLIGGGVVLVTGALGAAAFQRYRRSF
jgi:uncharacterized repeat protein (TIGR01451 family)